jgi:hypothetical protein
MNKIALSAESNSVLTRLKIAERVLTESDITLLVKVFRDITTITHLSLNEIKISRINFCKIFDALNDNRILRVLEVNHCVCNSDRDSFIKEVKMLEYLR